MTVHYVKGFKIDTQKVATIVGVGDHPETLDPLIDDAIGVIVHQLNQSAYLSIEVGYEHPGPDGERHQVLIVALEIGEDEEELKKKDLGEIDESIRVALPHVLAGPDVWELVD